MRTCSTEWIELQMRCPIAHFCLMSLKHLCLGILWNCSYYIFPSGTPYVYICPKLNQNLQSQLGASRSSTVATFLVESYKR